MSKKAPGTAESREGAFFREQERAALDRLKARMAVKKKPIDETDEKLRLKNILEKVGVREAIREYVQAPKPAPVSVAM